jgi:hypothetical protein
MNKLLTPLFLTLALGACDGGSGSEFTSAIITPDEGGSLQVADSETGITIPEGAVESEVEISLDIGTASDFAANENALEDVLVFEPTMVLSRPADLTFQLPTDLEPTQRVHLEQFIDGVWLRPELSGLEVGSGGIAYGRVDLLVPTAVVVDAVEPQ